ncbi:MAG TPA: TIGR01458 family HAD-type hydrolase [Acidimicrobiales bacterium]|nr:TIGR01458 family HAD-type hydrolase [Acidimicrobiales bacterium]
MDGRDDRLDGIEGLLVDIDGVLTLSWKAIDGASEAVARLRSAGVPVRYLTNTTSITRGEIVDRLGAAGMAVAAGEVFTAPVATASWIAAHHPEARCHLLNSGDLVADLAGIDIVDGDGPADLVVLGGAGPEFSYEALNRAAGLLLDGAALVAMHRNRYWRTDAGFALDTGAFVAALETAAGVTATVVGKPSPAFFATAVASLDLPVSAIAMVGDDVENDVLAAQGAGLAGILVHTGKYRPEALAAASGDPDHQIPSFATLPDLLGLP